MNLRHVRWGDYILTTDPPLPYDVTFRVFSLQDESNYQQVSAHKLLLAASSEVFHAQFFGALADSQRVVDIKETTFNAFKVCLQITIKPKLEESLIGVFSWFSFILGNCSI